MNRIFSIAAFFTMAIVGVSAKASELRCTISVNTEIIAEASTVLPSGKKTESFFASEEFELSLKALGSGLYELEVFDRIAPTRAYARARLSKAGDAIGYTFWERERLLDVDCAL